MKLKFKLISILLASAFFAAAPTLATAQPTTATTTPSQAEASDFVLKRSSELLKTLQTRRAEFRRNPEALKSYVNAEMNSLLDSSYSARLILGVHARGASESDIQAFADAMGESLMQRYGDALLNFEGNPTVRVKSESALPGNRGMRVATELVMQGQEPTPVDYMLRKVNGEWRVFDVLVEGVSYVQTFRNQFDAPLRRKSISQVTAELRSGSMQLNEVSQ